MAVAHQYQAPLYIINKYQMAVLHQYQGLIYITCSYEHFHCQGYATLVGVKKRRRPSISVSGWTELAGPSHQFSKAIKLQCKAPTKRLSQRQTLQRVFEIILDYLGSICYIKEHHDIPNEIQMPGPAVTGRLQQFKPAPPLFWFKIEHHPFVSLLIMLICNIWVVLFI